MSFRPYLLLTEPLVAMGKQVQAVDGMYSSPDEMIRQIRSSQLAG